VVPADHAFGPRRGLEHVEHLRAAAAGARAGVVAARPHGRSRSGAQPRRSEDGIAFCGLRVRRRVVLTSAAVGGTAAFFGYVAYRAWARPPSASTSARPRS
jgi:hypothetical protein